MLVTGGSHDFGAVVLDVCCSRLGRPAQTHAVILYRADGTHAAGQLFAVSAALRQVRERRRPVRLRLLRRAAPERGRFVSGVHEPTGRVAHRPPAGIRYRQPVPPTHRADGVPSRDGEGGGDAELGDGRRR